MTNIRRYYNEGNIYFLTHVTHKRIPILIDNFDLLIQSIKRHQTKIPFELIAWSVLPDHFHLVLNPLSNDLSNLMRRIKLSFSTSYRKRKNLNSGQIWQYRFWDHIIRNQEDLNHHIDYIHYNPVKHGLINKPFDWEFSSIHNHKNYYSGNWGVKEMINFNGEFGE